MKCIDCKYHSVLDGKHWCDFDRKKPKRIKPDDAIKDVPCIKLVERKVTYMTIDEAIARERQVAEKHRNDIVPKEDYHNMSWID